MSRGRIDAYLVCGGKYHDFDFARLELLKLLAEDQHIRVKVAQDFADVAAIGAADFLVTYTCDVRPSPEQTAALRAWVERGGRWFVLHATNSFLDPPAQLGQGVFTAVNTNPPFFELIGSEFLSHPSLHAYPVTISPGAEADPLVVGLEPFDAGETDELYLSQFHADVVPLLETRWTGTTQGFADAEWPDDEPRLVLYRRPCGAGEVVHFTLGHCRSTWDMVDHPFNGMEYPRIERGSWELGAFYEILRRGLIWAKTPGAMRSGADAAADVANA